jgi:hypothetical protein
MTYHAIKYKSNVSLYPSKPNKELSKKTSRCANSSAVVHSKDDATPDSRGPELEIMSCSVKHFCDVDNCPGILPQMSVVYVVQAFTWNASLVQSASSRNTWMVVMMRCFVLMFVASGMATQESMW